MKISEHDILYAYNNLSTKEAIEYLGISKSSYYNKLNELGVRLNKAYKVSDDKIIDAFNSSKSLREAAYKLGMNHAAYSKRIQKLGLNFKDKRDLRKYKVNDEAFSIINEEVAYWLGYIAADGSVVDNKLQFHVCVKDRDIVDNVKEFLKSDAPIHIGDASYDYHGIKLSSKSLHFRVTSSKIVNDLAKYGIVQNKTYKDIDFLYYIPEEYKFSFIAGLFDGDGSISSIDKHTGRLVYTINIVGNKNNILSIHNYLLSIQVDNKLYNKNNLYIICIRKKEALTKFINMYITQSKFNNLLNRKLEKAKEYIRNINTESYKEEIEHAKLYECIMCKKPIAYQSKTGMCNSCANVVAKGKSPKPSKEELQALLDKGLQIKQIAEMYERTPSTVSYWIKSYELYDYSKDMKVKGVTCLENGMYFSTIAEAARFLVNSKIAYGTNINGISYQISLARNNNKPYLGFHWI